MTEQKNISPAEPSVPTYGHDSSSASVGNLQSFEKEDIIFEEGDVSDFAYVVVEGSVELTKDVEGTEIFLAEIGRSDLFGEMGLIDGSNRSATAAALEETVLLRFNKDELMDKLSNDSDFAAPVLSQLVRQLRDTSDRFVHEQVLSLQRAADAADVVEPVQASVFERMRGFFDAEKDLIEFQPDAVEIERQKTPAIAVVTLFSIVFFIIGIFIWAYNSSIDTAVAAFGRMTTEVPNIVVQPSDTAVITAIHAKEGQAVKKGQLLATLDATLVSADVNVSRTALVSLLAQERRLIAESRGQAPANGFSDNPAVNALQTQAYVSRQTGLRAKQISFDEQIKQIQAEVKTNVRDAKDLGEQAAVLGEIEAMRAKLMKSGHGSRVNYLSAKHQRLSVAREQRRLLSTRIRMTHQLKALKADRGSMLANWQSNVAEELVRTRRERERMAEQLTKTEHKQSLVRLLAPADGIVLSIAARSVGSVIKQAEPMFTIVPANVPMEMEVDVLPKDVGLIQVGDFVRIKLDAIPFQKHGIMEGRVRLISEDAVEVGGNSSQTVYRSRIEIIGKNLRNVPDSFRLTPGLTGSADITVGKRKIITYFIYPLIRAMDSSFKEP